jgi:hypothetical protein
VIEQSPVGKRPLGRRIIRREDAMKKDVERMGAGSDWRNLAMNIEG